jgi:hypothetical protein
MRTLQTCSNALLYCADVLHFAPVYPANILTKLFTEKQNAL